MEFDLENPLTISHDINSDTLTSLFSIESHQMQSETYFQTLLAGDFDISIRREAIASISQLCCSCEDTLLAYLAVNYLDRFLSLQGMLQPKPWLIKLLAISCVSLAAKMKKTDFSPLDNQWGGGMIFDTQTIQRMEVLILGALQWRMRSITPFSFITFFISLFKPEAPPLLKALKARATQIIFQTQKDVGLLVFKPSIIAASALLSACHELLPMQLPCFQKALSNCSYVNNEDMLQCYSRMQDTVVDGFEFDQVEEAASSVATPLNVLDQTFSSSTQSGKTTVTSITTLRLDKDKKRISEYCKDHRVQISQIQQC